VYACYAYDQNYQVSKLTNAIVTQLMSITSQFNGLWNAAV